MEPCAGPQLYAVKTQLSSFLYFSLQPCLKLLAQQRCSGPKQSCQQILCPQQITEAGRLIQGLCCSVVVLTRAACASLCYRLPVAASVHMSCCAEWVRLMEYTIISCLRRFSSAEALCLPGLCRKRPDTNLQTQMRRELGIIQGSLSSTFTLVLPVVVTFLALYSSLTDFSHQLCLHGIKTQTALKVIKLINYGMNLQN